MRINSVLTVPAKNFSKQHRTELQSKCQNVSEINNNSIAFKGFMGKTTGGLIGAGVAGLCTLAAMATPVGWVAAAALVASEAGGAIIGGAIGDKIEGKDDD